MYCEKCGKPLDENGKCNCQNKEKNSGNKKRISLKLMVSGLVVVAIVIALIVFFATRPKKVELAEFMVKDPEIVGLNGYASIETEELFDYEALGNAVVSDKKAGSEANLEDLDENMSDEELESAFTEGFADVARGAEEMEKLEENIHLTFFVNEKEVKELNNLSNGDIVEVKVSSKEAVNKYYNKKFVSGSCKYKVSGLEEGTVVSVFDEDKLQVTFEGGNGKGSVSVKVLSENEIFDYITIKEKEPSSKLSNGDKVVLEATYDQNELIEQGYALKEVSKEYTVSGLAEFVSKAEEIPESALQIMKEAALEKMNDSFQLVFMGAGSGGKVTYHSAYLWTAKSEDAEAQNYVVIVGEYMDKDNGEKLYCYSEFYDIAISKDGVPTTNGDTEFGGAPDNYRLSEEELKTELFEKEGYDCEEIK